MPEPLLPTSAVSARAPESSRTAIRWLALAVVCVGTMMAFVSLSSTIGSLARIQADLHSSPTETVWVTSAYSLVVASLILAAGTLGDLLGRRLVFLVGAVFFIGGSITAFAADSTGLLITAQAIMGVGGAAILPSSLAVVSHAFVDPRERTEAVSIWAGSSGLGLAVGPLGSGALLQYFSWHSVFMINVVLGIIALAGALLLVPESKQPDRQLDPVGVALGTVAVAALTFAIIEGKTLGYASEPIIFTYAVFAVTLLGFIGYEARHPDPMIDVRLFRSASFSAVMGVAATTMFGFVGTALLTVLYLQNVQAVTPLGAAVRSLAMFIPFILVSAVAGKIVHRVGFKVMLTVGLVVMAVGIMALRAAQAGPGFSNVWPGLVVAGIGSGLLIAPSTAAAIISVKHSQAGMASAVVNMFRQLGNVLGASVLGTILTTKFADDLSNRLSADGLPKPAVDQIVDGAQRGHHASGLPDRLATLVGDAVRQAFTDAYHLGVLVAGIVVLAVAIPTLILVRRSPAE
ncbi:MFS transporter [Nocardia sp. 2YAB30]|uniref:MFS transporter n=1 Tax=unclassified Nocardia TaxID=2637762 RepID=UPI003F995B72